MSNLGADTKDVVGVIVLDKKGRTLLVQGMCGKWSFPKGRRKENETSLEGAIREAREEAGIDLSKVNYFLSVRLRFGTYYCYFFDGEGDEVYLNDPLTPDEIQQVKWVSPNSSQFREADKNADLRYFIQTSPLVSLN